MYNSSIYPIKINKYQPQTGEKPVHNDERDGQSNSSAKQEQQERNYNTIYKPTPGYYGNKTFGQYAVQAPITQTQQSQQTEKSNLNKTSNPPKYMERQSFPNGEKTAIDYTQSKINISQVIKDFKNTTEAIGSPDDVKETVYTYISLVQKESEKDSPNKKIIQSNLKNASQVLDEYITATLKKPSKVVEGWIDSLFLQKVDYKYDEKVVNPEYSVKFPEKNKKAENTNTKTPSATQNPQQEKISAKEPEDKNPFYSLLVSAKREQNPAEALNKYEQIIENAKNENDKKSMAIAYFESGKLYDSFNSFNKALENYSAAIENSDNEGLKAQAYLKMGQINYDSTNLKQAGENYFSSIAYFGQAENPKAQAVILSKTGKLVSEQYDKNNAKDYFDVANILAKEVGNKNLSGKINQKAGEAFSSLGEPLTALSYYKDSAAFYNGSENNFDLAKDYQAAAQLMLDLGNKAKAKTLLNKAFKISLKTDNEELTKQIQSQIAVLS